MENTKTESVTFKVKTDTQISKRQRLYDITEQAIRTKNDHHVREQLILLFVTRLMEDKNKT